MTERTDIVNLLTEFRRDFDSHVRDENRVETQVDHLSSVVRELSADLRESRRDRQRLSEAIVGLSIRLETLDRDAHEVEDAAKANTAEIHGIKRVVAASAAGGAILVEGIQSLVHFLT